MHYTPAPGRTWQTPKCLYVLLLMASNGDTRGMESALCEAKSGEAHAVMPADARYLKGAWYVAKPCHIRKGLGKEIGGWSLSFPVKAAFTPRSYSRWDLSDLITSTCHHKMPRHPREIKNASRGQCNLNSDNLYPMLHLPRAIPAFIALNSTHQYDLDGTADQSAWRRRSNNVKRGTTCPRIAAAWQLLPDDEVPLAVNITPSFLVIDHLTLVVAMSSNDWATASVSGRHPLSVCLDFQSAQPPHQLWWTKGFLWCGDHQKFIFITASVETRLHSLSVSSVLQKMNKCLIYGVFWFLVVCICMGWLGRVLWHQKHHWKWGYPAELGRTIFGLLPVRSYWLWWQNH